jgi:hypothetical protein
MPCLEKESTYKGTHLQDARITEMERCSAIWHSHIQRKEKNRMVKRAIHQLETDYSQVRVVFEKGIHPLYEWVRDLAMHQPHAEIWSQNALHNLVARYLSASVGKAVLVYWGEVYLTDSRAINAYVAEYGLHSNSQSIRLPLEFARVMQAFDQRFSRQQGRSGAPYQIGEVAAWLYGTQEMTDLLILSREGWYGVRVAQYQSGGRWGVVYRDEQSDEWHPFMRNARERRDYQHKARSLSFARTEIARRRSAASPNERT